jgi:regulator of protease activity HflC (stomatin/prohibitin superfamily)
MNVRFIVIGVAALLGIIVVASLINFASVNTGYRGVRLNFQKPTGEILSEGLYFYSPVFGQSIVQMNVQTVADEVRAAAASRDLQSVQTTVTVNYHLDPGHVVDVYDKLRNDYQARIIDPTVQEAVKAATARHVATDLVANRTQVRDSIDRDLRSRVAPYGIVIDQILITDFAFDKAFQDAVEAKVAAQQDLLTAQINAQKALAVARGAAAAQSAQRLTLTPVLLEKQLLDKWDGKLPVYMAGNTSPFTLLQIGGSHD